MDIWNLGALVLELVFGQCMFDGGATGEYEVRSHLEEMNALLGPFPKVLIEKAGLKEAKGWFDEDGNVLSPAMQRVVSLERRFARLEVDEAEKFLIFVKAMLELDPGKRKSARELLESDPRLQHEYGEDSSSEEEEERPASSG